MDMQYLHSDADGIEFYLDTNSQQVVIRDSRHTDEPVRECRIPWSILKTKVKEALGHD